MKSQLDMITINKTREKKQNNSSTMSWEERQKFQKRKEIKRKKRRRRRLISLCFHMTVIVTVVFFSISLFAHLFDLGIGDNWGINLVDRTNAIITSFKNDQDAKKEADVVYVSKYGTSIPRKLMEEEIDYKLKNLADQYTEFQEIYDNAKDYPKDLLAALCNNPDMIDYVKGYLTADQTVKGGLTESELAQDVPLFIQWDTRWGYFYYGDDNIALSGCAPTCLSMVTVSLTKNTEATPDKVAKFAEENGYYMAGTGTMWSLMTEGCKEFGIVGKELVLEKTSILSELEEGNPIICSMGPGDFTTSGHFIVLTEVKNGKIQVNDPNNRARSSRLWDYETLEGQIKNLWVFMV